MNVLVVYSHPSFNSFTYLVKQHFLKGLGDSGNSYELSDLYAMKFNSVLSEEEYLREAFYDETKPIPEDVAWEQEKINASDSIAFIYPVFWTEAPSMLTGWFQRVFTYGFAYGQHPKMKQLQKAVFLVTMGGSLKEPIRQQQVAAMKTVMIGDRMQGRVKESQMIIFDEMVKDWCHEEDRQENIRRFTKQAYYLGYTWEK